MTIYQYLLKCICIMHVKKKERKQRLNSVLKESFRKFKKKKKEIHILQKCLSKMSYEYSFSWSTSKRKDIYLCIHKDDEGFESNTQVNNLEKLNLNCNWNLN